LGRSEREVVLVSACLCGVCCRFDGKDDLSDELMDRLADCLVVPVCPEQLGGLATPRVPADFRDGSGPEALDGQARLVRRDGVGVTDAFVRGAREALKIAARVGARRAFFHERSPSCGVESVYVEGSLVPGCGVATALFRRSGIEVTAVG